MNLRLLFFSLIFAFAARPVTAGELSLKKGSPVTIELYNPKHRLFLIKLNESPEHGPNWATPKNLQKALKLEGTLDDFMKKPNRWAGSVFTLQEDLPLADIPMADPAPSKPHASPKGKNTKGR